jgi:hypothetical protein
MPYATIALVASPTHVAMIVVDALAGLPSLH